MPRAKAATKETTTKNGDERRVARVYRGYRAGGLVPGVTLIVLGLLFLAQTYTDYKLNNWWALLLLIPTIAAWASAYRFYRVDNRVGGRAWGAFVGGLFPAVLAIIFLDNLDWGKIWPIFLILLGLGAMSPRPKLAEK